MKKVLVFGNGLVGKQIFDALSKTDGIAATSVTTRIVDSQQVMGIISMHEPDVVVNAIGKTGSPNVDACEDDKDATFFSNTVIPMYLSRACDKTGATLVHISSGCVYTKDDTGGVFTEEDEPNFDGSFYSFTKKAAERIVSYKPNVLTVRLRMPLTPDKNPRGLFAKLMKYDSIIYELNSITYLPDFVETVVYLIQRGTTGIFNLVNPEPVTHSDVLAILQEVSGEDILSGKTFIPAEELKTRAPRSNCILSADKVENLLAKDGVELGMRPTALAILAAAEGYCHG